MLQLQDIIQFCLGISFDNSDHLQALAKTLYENIDDNLSVTPSEFITRLASHYQLNQFQKLIQALIKFEKQAHNNAHLPEPKTSDNQTITQQLIKFFTVKNGLPEPKLNTYENKSLIPSLQSYLTNELLNRCQQISFKQTHEVEAFAKLLYENVGIGLAINGRDFIEQLTQQLPQPEKITQLACALIKVKNQDIYNQLESKNSLLRNLIEHLIYKHYWESFISDTESDPQKLFIFKEKLMSPALIPIVEIFQELAANSIPIQIAANHMLSCLRFIYASTTQSEASVCKQISLNLQKQELVNLVILLLQGDPEIKSLFETLPSSSMSESSQSDFRCSEDHYNVCAFDAAMREDKELLDIMLKHDPQEKRRFLRADILHLNRQLEIDSFERALIEVQRSALLEFLKKTDRTPLALQKKFDDAVNMLIKRTAQGHLEAAKVKEEAMVMVPEDYDEVKQDYEELALGNGKRMSERMHPLVTISSTHMAVEFHNSKPLIVPPGKNLNEYSQDLLEIIERKHTEIKKLVSEITNANQLAREYWHQKDTDRKLLLEKYLTNPKNLEGIMSLLAFNPAEAPREEAARIEELHKLLEDEGNRWVLDGILNAIDSCNLYTRDTGRNLLHYAVEYGKSGIIELLMTRGVDLFRKDKTAYEIKQERYKKWLPEESNPADKLVKKFLSINIISTQKIDPSSLISTFIEYERNAQHIFQVNIGQLVDIESTDFQEFLHFCLQKRQEKSDEYHIDKMDQSIQEILDFKYEKPVTTIRANYQRFLSFLKAYQEKKREKKKEGGLSPFQLCLKEPKKEFNYKIELGQLKAARKKCLMNILCALKDRDIHEWRYRYQIKNHDVERAMHLFANEVKSFLDKQTDDLLTSLDGFLSLSNKNEKIELYQKYYTKYLDALRENNPWLFFEYVSELTNKMAVEPEHFEASLLSFKDTFTTKFPLGKFESWKNFVKQRKDLANGSQITESFLKNEVAEFTGHEHKLMQEATALKVDREDLVQTNYELQQKLQEAHDTIDEKNEIIKTLNENTNKIDNIIQKSKDEKVPLLQKLEQFEKQSQPRNEYTRQINRELQQKLQKTLDTTDELNITIKTLEAENNRKDETVLLQKNEIEKKDNMIQKLNDEKAELFQKLEQFEKSSRFRSENIDQKNRELQQALQESLDAIYKKDAIIETLESRVKKQDKIITNQTNQFKEKDSEIEKLKNEKKDNIIQKLNSGQKKEVPPSVAEKRQRSSTTNTNQRIFFDSLAAFKQTSATGSDIETEQQQLPLSSTKTTTTSSVSVESTSLSSGNPRKSLPIKAPVAESPSYVAISTTAGASQQSVSKEPSNQQAIPSNNLSERIQFFTPSPVNPKKQTPTSNNNIWRPKQLEKGNTEPNLSRETQTPK
ncbi:MAG: hypothetical protein WBE18_01230 [Gammaproteobacteria bacterium]